MQPQHGLPVNLLRVNAVLIPLFLCPPARTPADTLRFPAQAISMRRAPAGAGAARIGSARRRDGALGRAARTGRAAVAAADQLHRDVCACDALRRHAPGRGRDDGAVVLAEQLEYATGRRLRRTILLALLPHFPSFLYDILFICS